MFLSLVHTLLIHQNYTLNSSAVSKKRRTKKKLKTFPFSCVSDNKGHYADEQPKQILFKSNLQRCLKQIIVGKKNIIKKTQYNAEKTVF